jgi:hypothetical protein
MEYTLNDKYQLINNELMKNTSKNPIDIVNEVMHKDFINIHGPEHHYLDGASFLVAYKNAGSTIDLDKALAMLAERTIKMPGAMCGFWRVCGSSTSLGAALSIIHEVTPLSSFVYYNDNMEYTSSVIQKMSEIGGPRCCKRNAYISITKAVNFVKDKYGIEMEISNINCEFSSKNKQCLGLKCPFFKGLK